jgi:hypothetical protein
MKNKYPFKVKLQKDMPAFLVSKWKKSFQFEFIWQGNSYKAEYWWDSDGKEGIEWKYDKPNFGEEKDKIMEQLFEYIEKYIDRDSLNFITIVEI